MHLRKCSLNNQINVIKKKQTNKQTFAEQSCHTDSVAVPFVVDYIGRLALEVGFKLERTCK